jgi:AraC-like DNA-binding protein
VSNAGGETAKGLARHQRRLVGEAEALGLDRGRLLEAGELTEAELIDPDARIPVIKRWRLWSYISSQVIDPDLGLRFGSTLGVRQFGLVGYTMLHSRTLHQAFGRMVRYGRILSDLASDLALEEDDGAWRLTNLRPMPAFNHLRQPVDESFAAIVAIARQITGEKITPRQVDFPYRRPASVEALRSYFRADLRFATPVGSIVINDRDMRLPLTAADEDLTGYLDQLAGQRLDELSREETFLGRVRRAIWQGLSDGQPTLTEVATELNVSPRTLQRRLNEEEVSFTEMVDSIRREMAPILLQDRHMAVYEIAYLLGYGEPSTFFRAFRRWHGQSPREYREQIAV